MSQLKDSGLLQLSAIVRAGMGMVTAFGLAHALGDSEQGRYYVAVAVFSLLYLVLSTGVHVVTVSHVAQAEDRHEARRWLAFHLIVNGSVAVVLGLAGLALPWVAPRVSGLSHEMAWWAALLCWTPALELGRAWATAQLQSRRRMASLARMEIAAEITRAAMVLGGAIWTGSGLGAVVGWLIASGLSAPISLLALARERGQLNLPGTVEVIRHLREAPLGAGLREGIPYGVLRSSAMLVIEVLPALAVFHFGADEDVAHLRLAQRMAAGALMLSSGLSRTALPLLSAHSGDRAEFGRLWLRSSLLAGISVAAGWVVLLLLLPTLLTWLAPAGFVDPVRHICLLLTPGLIAMALGSSSSAFYVATGRTRAAARIILVGAPLGAVAVLSGAAMSSPAGAAIGLSLAQQGELVHMIFVLRWLNEGKGT